MDLAKPHRRFNPLTQEWILVSPQRATRPWQGAVEKPASAIRPAHDPKCYLCAGNTRVNGVTNPSYTGVYVFENDFPALLTDAVGKQDEVIEPVFLRAQQETGVCRVICFSPRHDLTLADLPAEEIRGVIDAWVEQCTELGARPDISYVQLFENKGEVMGCSNPHPHGQLWATAHVPTEVEKETCGQLAHRGLLQEYLAHELSDRSRVLYENDHFVALVPFWAVWPFETMILPKHAVRRIVELDASGCDGLADAMAHLTSAYDRVFDVSFPYTMGVHQAPYDGEAHDEWHMHLHFYPPLLRSAAVKKFMVGYEMLAQPQRDLTAEQAAERLRACVR
ncbi:MAG: UDP-glucose--hexose-1-phosphate uridylyltransferase [Chloroflexi bacterium]|nr:UDP-glucose--hexose-1-phosphate uridylyltransferase [Chloroflexota bacterium]